MTSLDRELRVRAIELLRVVAQGRQTDLFVTEHTNPWRGVRSSPEGTEIVNRAEEVVELAQRLGEDVSALAAAKILAAFRNANDLSNPHRLGPIRRAASLLGELDEPAGRAV